MTKALYEKRCKKGVEGGLFHVVLGISESFMDVTDGDPSLRVQLIGKSFG